MEQLDTSYSGEVAANRSSRRTSTPMMYTSRFGHIMLAALAIAICCTTTTATYGIGGHHAGAKLSILEGRSLGYGPEFSMVGAAMHLRGGAATAKAAKPKKASKSSEEDQYEVSSPTPWFHPVQKLE